MSIIGDLFNKFIGNNYNQAGKGVWVTGNSSSSNSFDFDALDKSLSKFETGIQNIFDNLSTNATALAKKDAEVANAFSKEMQEDQQQFNAAQADLAWERSQASAQAQMDFQERMANEAMAYQTNMANTAYQRAVKDMQAAGLNPILAYTQGGASAPAGVSASGASASASAASSSLGTSHMANTVGGYNADVDSMTVKVIGQVVTTAFDLLKSLSK